MRSIAHYLVMFLYYRIVKRRKDARHLALIAQSHYFDAGYYLQHNSDVAASGMDPAIHFLDHGAREGRSPSEWFHTASYVTEHAASLNDNVNPLLHFLTRRPSESQRGLAVSSPKPARKSRAKKARPKSLYDADYMLKAGTGPRAAPRYVIYTAVVGGYDELLPPAVVPPNCDFVAFSDHPLDVPGWKVLPLNYFHHDWTRIARFLKLHPHLYFPDYTHSIWIDANIGINGDVGAFFDRLGEEGFMSAFAHPLRDCVYREAHECIARRKDAQDAILTQVDRYRAAGVPEALGLWETNVLVRRHNDRRCIELMEHWWREVEVGSRRDQLSLPIACRSTSAEIALLDIPGISARRHPLLTFTSHRRGREKLGQFGMVAGQKGSLNTRRAQPITIGICVHNGLEAVKPCLQSVLAARNPSDVVVIIDDFSGAETADYLEAFAAGHDRVKLLRNTTNLGYTRSANRFFKACATDWIILLNSDTIVPPRAFDKLIEAGESHSRLAIVSPLSNAASWQTVPIMVDVEGSFRVNRLPPGVTPAVMDTICEQAALKVVPFVPTVNGFCLAIRRNVLEQVGYFDENAFPIGYGEEDDLCFRMADAGYVCGVATNAYVFHAKSVSFMAERRRQLSADGARALAKKHSSARVRAVSTLMQRHPALRIVRIRIKAALRSLVRQKDDDGYRTYLRSIKNINPEALRLPGPSAGKYLVAQDAKLANMNGMDAA